MVDPDAEEEQTGSISFLFGQAGQGSFVCWALRGEARLG